VADLLPVPVRVASPRGAAMAPSVAAAAGEHGPIDLAVLCVPAAATAGALADAAAGGVRAAVVCGGGFAEAGPEGERHQRALARTAAETGVRVLGPNTSGFLAPGRGITASFVPGAAAVPAGRIAGSEEHTSEPQSREKLERRLLLGKKNRNCI